MRGFKPKRASGANNYADGGVVSGIKRALGFDPERAARIAEYKAQQKAEAAAAAAPAAAPKLAGGALQNAANALRNRRKQIDEAAGYANGGMVRGPGTGTSDDIETEIPAGSYIMPADTTRKVGAEALSELGKPVPVALSNGEYQMPPEQVHAVGVEALNQVKNATHTPSATEAARGFGPVQEGEPRLFFEGGGSPSEEERRARLSQGLTPYAPNYGPAGLNPQARINAQASAPAPAPISPQAQADRAAVASAWNTAKGASEDAGRAIADVATLVPRGLVGAYDSAVVRPMRAAGMNAAYLSPSLVPDGVDPASMTPFTDQKRMREVAAPAPNAGAGRGSVNPPAADPSAPAPQTATAPAAQASLAGDAYMPGADANTRPMFDTPAAPASNQVMPGVYQHGRGQYSDNQAGMGFAPGAGNPSANNIAAADALASRSAADVAGLVAAQDARGFQPQQAPQVRHSGNDWQARNDLRNAQVSASSIMNNGGRWDQHGKGVVSPERAAYLAMLGTDQALRQAQPAADVMAMRENAGIQREGMQQEGATTRTGIQEQGSNARAAVSSALQRDEFGLKKEAAGFQTRAAQQQEQLRNVLLDPKSTPEQRAVAQRNLAALSGKTAADRMQTVTLPDTTNEMGQVVRGGQALVRVLEDGTVQQVPIGAQQGAALPPGMKRQIGTSNGRPVYEDMNGKQVIAKG